MGRRHEQLQGPYNRSTVVAATTARDVVSADGEASHALVANETGNFVGQLLEDTADRTIAMVAGHEYKIRVKEIDATSAIAVTLLFA